MGRGATRSHTGPPRHLGAVPRFGYARPVRSITCIGLALLAACGSGPAGAPSSPAAPCTPRTLPGPPALTTLASGFGSWAGKARPLVGVSAGDAAAKAAPYDLRYLYLAGALPDGAGPCASCASGCTSQGASCANSAGCNWWGCWQYDQDPPGAYVRAFVQRAKADGQIPMFTYYLVLQASGLAEGTTEVAAVNDAAFLARYLNDWRFVLQQIGREKAVLHLEPDFWGYGQHLNAAPASIPAAVKAANPTDCGAEDNTLAGLGRCLIAMVRTYATHATVGLHASGWGSGLDCFNNTSCPSPAAEGTKVGAWLAAAGAGSGDFIASDMSDRDAGWYEAQCAAADTTCRQLHWWSDGNFARAFSWAKAAAEAAGKPVLWWQTPVGNSRQGNVANHWKDNRVEWLFPHIADLAAAHGAGVAFGAGVSGQTTPETDGGVLAASTALYAAGGGTLTCP